MAISALGTLFILLAGRWLLPARARGDDTAERFRLDDYFTELTVLPNSPFLDKTVEELNADQQNNLRVVGCMRGGRLLRDRAGQLHVQEGDVLLVRTTPEQLLAIREEPAVELRPVQKYGAKSQQ
ncbi:MAG TPA: TrkA C-terminal domain-containing protein, partial [Herpetosiphonaceae bacterium]|nr:TrkA C-terminal domain-containing protein [Herpetosiphonaceae bacterium]